jgi:predicted ATP-grasp superfamily ATP-dependent carboligase
VKIAVFEYITGGGFCDAELPPSLAREGDAMLQALIRDLTLVEHMDLLVPRDLRLLPLPPIANLQTLPVKPETGCDPTWQLALKTCDTVWPIAPETGGILERLCRDAAIAGKPILNSNAETVRLSASKMATLSVLTEHGIAVVPTFPGYQQPGDLPYPRVIKPDDGVGCEGLTVIPLQERWNAGTLPPGWLVQPLLEGDSLSLSALFAQGRSRLLTCNRQHMASSAEGLSLEACEVNAIPDHDGRWQALSDRVAQAIPGLWGYAGIDLILTDNGPKVLEINPRLTTSYAGIREATGENPAAMVVDLLETGLLPNPRRPGGKSVTVTVKEKNLHEH